MRRLLVTLLAIALAGCFGSRPVELVPSDELGADASLWEYVNETRLSQVLKDVTHKTALIEHKRIPMVDGVKLDVWVARPDVTELVPIVLEVTPYHPGGDPQQSDAFANHWFPRSAMTLIPRGYAFGIVNVRGTGNSEGCFTQGGPQEAKDTATVIEALAKEPWSNGNVGIIGVSYPGTTPQDVWVEAPPSLKAIIPIAGISDLYKYNFVNGVPINVQGFGFNTYYWYSVGLGGTLGGLPFGVGYLRDPANAPGAIAGEACQDQFAVQEGGVSSTLDGNKDAYWQARDFLAELKAAGPKPRAAVYYIHGLQDWNVKPHMMEDWLPAITQSGVPFKIMLGQWDHKWPNRHDWLNTTMVAWFDQFLKGVDTGILDAPRVQVRSDNGRWRHEDVWPPVVVESRTYHLAPGKLQEVPGSGSVSYDDAHAATAEPAYVPGDRVLFEGSPVANDTYLSGMPAFEANVTASGARASLLLTLAVRNSTGTRSINYAAQSLNHVQSLASGDPDVAGERQHVKLRFFPQDDVVHKGEWLVLVAAGNLQRFWGDASRPTVDANADPYPLDPGPDLQPVSSGSTISIDLSGARFVLPIDSTILLENPQPGACGFPALKMYDCTKPKALD